MRNLDDLLTKVILEEHESQDAYKLEQTEQLDEATAAAGAAAAKPLQTQSLEQPGDSEQEAAVDPQERSECLIKIKDLLLEKYHVSPCKMITICLYDEKISEGEKLDLILDLLKLSIKEIKEPNELYLENLRLCVEHALDHKKIDLLRALLNSRDIYNCEDEAQEASAASASSDKKTYVLTWPESFYVVLSPAIILKMKLNYYMNLENLIFVNLNIQSLQLAIHYCH